jgi:hypothetical protein
MRTVLYKMTGLGWERCFNRAALRSPPEPPGLSSCKDPSAPSVLNVDNLAYDTCSWGIELGVRVRDADSSLQDDRLGMGALL